MKLGIGRNTVDASGIIHSSGGVFEPEDATSNVNDREIF